MEGRNGRLHVPAAALGKKIVEQPGRAFVFCKTCYHFAAFHVLFSSALSESYLDALVHLLLNPSAEFSHIGL